MIFNAHYQISYYFFQSTLIVGLLQRGKIEVVQVKFSLESEFVERVEKVEVNGGSRAAEGSRIPAHAEQLPVTLIPWSVGIAHTERDPDVVPTVHVDDGEVEGFRPDGTTVTVVSKVTYEPD